MLVDPDRTRIELISHFTRIGHTLSPLEIVVANIAAGKRYGQDDCVTAGRDINSKSFTIWKCCRQPASRLRAFR
jgi:hypothetical protein